MNGSDHDAMLRKGFERIQMVISDIDGILTDGTVGYPEAGGGVVKFFHVRDGTAIAWLRSHAIRFGLCSGHSYGENRAWLQRLGLGNIPQRFNVEDKALAVAEIAQEVGIDLDRIAYIGDDHPDIPAFKIVGFPITVAEAPAAVLRAADIVLPCRSGRGVIACVADLIFERGARTSSQGESL